MAKKTRSLQFKVLTVLCISLVVFLGILIYLNGTYQVKALKEQAHYSSGLLANSVYNGIIGPMSIGDGDTIRQQMKDFNNGFSSAQIYIFASL